MTTENTLAVSQEFLLPKNLKENIPTFVENVRSFLKGSDGFTVDLAKPIKSRPIKKKLDAVSYADLREVQVFVPAGLTSSYLDYLTVLDKAVAITEGLQEKILNPFARWLAIGLANPESFKNVRGGSSLRDFEPHNIDKVILELGAAFRKGSSLHQVPMKVAFARNADVHTVLEKANELNERFMKTDRKAVKEKVAEITELLDTLIERVEEAEENYDLSPVSLDLLSKLSFTLAQEVEFYGTVGFQLSSTMVSLHNTVEKLEDAIKKLRRG